MIGLVFGFTISTLPTLYHWFKRHAHSGLITDSAPTLCNGLPPKHHRITLVLKTLHWLKVPQHIQHKIVYFTYSALQTSFTFASHPTNNRPGLFAHHRIFQLCPPVSSALKFCNCCFLVYSAPILCNELPNVLWWSDHLLNSNNLTSSPRIMLSPLPLFYYAENQTPRCPILILLSLSPLSEGIDFGLRHLWVIESWCAYRFWLRL